MNKVIKRLLIFFIGLPVVLAIVVFLPFFNNLVMNIVVTVCSGIGAVEFSDMLRKKKIFVSKIESFILGALAPAAVTLHVSAGISQWLVIGICMTGAGYALMSGVFSRSSEIETVMNKVIGSFSLLVYPGFFVYWLIKMNFWGNSYAILLFLFMTFACDSLAWFFGSLFGENNRGLFAVSPNKSIAGFIGGLLGPVILSIITALFFSSMFYLKTEYSIGQLNTSASLLLLAIVLGLCTGVAAVFGDLAESAIKRSCDFKDSGNLILGRGGVLDSIDSVAVAAPVFYLLYSTIFMNI